MIVSGARQTVGTSTYVAFVARYTAAGNPISSYTFGPTQGFDGLEAAPDGSVLGIAGYPDYRITRLDSNFAEVWSMAVPSDSEIEAGIDSTGAIVVTYRDTGTASPVLRKFTPDGMNELWNVALTNTGYDTRLAIDGADAIWIASAFSVGGPETLTVQKISP